MPLLHLTSTEQAAFTALPASLRRACKVKHEKRVFHDTRERFQTRLQTMTLRDPTWTQLRKNIGAADSDPQAVVRMLEHADLSEMDPHDVHELYFALGPNLVSALLLHELTNAKTENDMAYVVHLAEIRHALLDAFTSAFS